MAPKKLAPIPEIAGDELDLVNNTIAKLDLAPDVLRHTTKMIVGEQTKYISWEIPNPKGQDDIKIIQLTDVQFGNKGCKVRRVLEFRDWVLAEPNRYMIWTGDMVDAWAMHSPGSPFDQTGNPRRQVMQFCEIWAPARHRVLGYVGGNHERRGIPSFDDLGTLLSALLRIPYSNGKQLIDVHYGKHQPFKISQWHGRGGARTKGTVAQTLHRFATEGDSQLYLMGHLHQPMVLPFWKESRSGNSIVATKTIAALGSSFLDTWGTYAEIAGYSGGDVLMPCAILEPSGKWEVRLR